MKIANKIKFCLAVLIFIISSNKIYAITQEEAGQIIAQFAINFYDNYASETIYSLTGWTEAGGGHRGLAYKGQKTSGMALPSSGMRGRGMQSIKFTDKYAMDCVGFVSFCVRHSLGIGNESFTVFVSPQSGGKNGFEPVKDGSRKPGDILATSGHVAVYIGNGEVIDSAAVGPNRSITRRAKASVYPKTFRIKQTTAANINAANTTVQFKGKGSAEYTFGGESNTATAYTEVLSGTAPSHWENNCKDYSGTFNWTNVTYVSSDGTSTNEYTSGSGGQYVPNAGTAVLSSAENKNLLSDLFDGNIPTSSAQMSKWLVSVQVPYLDKNGNRKTRNLQVHKKLAENFIKALTELADSGFKAYDLGTYCWRKVNNGSGSNTLSQHSYGVAIDINPSENYYPGVTSGLYKPGENEYSLTEKEIAIMNKYGFRWGGNYKDYMHFSISGR